MNISLEIYEALKKAIKSRDFLNANTLRLVISSIKYEEIQKGSALSEEEILELLNKEVKKRDEAIAGFQKGKRLDLVAKEEKEKEILLHFLPKRLSKKELETLIKQTIEASQVRDFGSVMKKVMQEVKGRADGVLVRSLVEKALKA